MERFIKVKGQWIDTLKEQKDLGRYYYIDKGEVHYYTNETDDYNLGKLEDEGNLLIKDSIDEFFELYPTKGYKTYLKYCEFKNLTPVKKSEFKKRKPINEEPMKEDRYEIH